MQVVLRCVHRTQGRVISVHLQMCWNKCGVGGLMCWRMFRLACTQVPMFSFVAAWRKFRDLCFYCLDQKHLMTLATVWERTQGGEGKRVMEGRWSWRRRFKSRQAVVWALKKWIKWWGEWVGEMKVDEKVNAWNQGVGDGRKEKGNEITKRGKWTSNKKRRTR